MKILSVIGAIAVLLVAGLAVAMMTAPNVQVSDQAPLASINDRTPLVSINDQVSSYNQTVTAADNSSVMHNFTITVDARVDGKKMPIADAMVCIYSVNVTNNATTNTTTIVLQKVAQNSTDANGVVNFNLTDGKYIIIARYHGLNGFGKINLTDDMSRIVMLHNWNGEFQNGMGCSKMVTIQSGAWGHHC